MPLPELPLHTDRLELRRLEVGDLDAYHGYQGREDVARYLLDDPLDRAAAAARLHKAVTMTGLDRVDDRVELGMVRKATGELIGDVMLILRSIEDRTGEIGYILHPDHHRQGFAREAVERALRMAFEDLGWHRVIGRCDARNEASAGLMRRVGMRQEAHFVRSRLVKGRWNDELVFAVLADEWTG